MALIINNKPAQIDNADLEQLVSRVFFKSIDLLGGIRNLTEYRTLTWLPSLARSAYAVVLREEYLKSEVEIAQIIGLTRNTVRNILHADPNAALDKIRMIEQESAPAENKVLTVHLAGAIAKLAYKMIKEGQEAQSLLEFCRQMTQDSLKVCDTPWAYLVLKHSKGMRYPITSAEQLLEKLGNLKINDFSMEQIAAELFYPIRNPAQLLHEIKEFLDMHSELMF